MSADRFTATYLIETAHPLEHAAQVMAGEQSAGTFMRVHGETDELRQSHMARVESIERLGRVDEPSLPGSRPPKQGEPIYQRAKVILSFPYINVGTNLPVLMSTVSGNLFELSQFSGLKLLDFTFPDAYRDAYLGPQFGIEGTRRLADVYDRPLIGTIIKPSVGLSPQQTGELVSLLAEAGLDFVKDDELMGDSPHSPFAERVKHVMDVVNRHADKTGKKVMVAFNISGDMDHLLHAHDLVYEAGGTCVMINMIQVGLSATIRLRQHAQLPIHGHRNGWGMFSRHDALGMSYLAFQKFFRMAGVDHLHVNGLRNKFCEPDASVIEAAQACLTPLWPEKSFTVMPVFSSGQWAGQAPDTYAALHSTDLMYLAGGGILAHPDGPAAGVRSLRQAWQAALEGAPLNEFAEKHSELKQALEKYGAL
ncbi:MAG: ribulose-bisphosphate carboxylase large subunit family protein [Anaerolineaceae bacterium]|nr:ribulose-bisphosphate carboxylase large subunit family protein [Anaerolineaceae bacterium]